MNPPPTIVSIQVVAVRPEGIDLERLKYCSQKKNKPTPIEMYVVKIYLQRKSQLASECWGLFINDEWIPKYFEFAAGIFFSIYDREHLQRLAGANVKFSLDHESFHDAAFHFPKENELPITLPEFDDLPLKSEVLDH